eukprot:6415759-Pyramimonas_sp.AAC.1
MTTVACMSLLRGAPSARARGSSASPASSPNFAFFRSFPCAASPSLASPPWVGGAWGAPIDPCGSWSRRSRGRTIRGGGKPQRSRMCSRRWCKD